MQTFHIITVGTIKEAYLNDGIREYEKRLHAYVRLVQTNLKEERLPDHPTPSQIQEALKREGKSMEAALPPRAYKIALCIEGEQLSSAALSAKLAATAVDGYSEVAFFIGSSFGLSPEIKAMCNLRLSFSKMTFPHQLMRLILFEQLYRVENLAAGGKYHK